LIIVQVFGSKELAEDVLAQELCIGCGACVNLCPYYKNYQGKTARLFPCDLAKGRCHAYCPKAEVDFDELSHHIRGVPYDGSPLGGYLRVLAARAGKKMRSTSFQGGGTVSALIAIALKSGMIDAAALTGRQGLTPVAALVTDWREVVTYATSKFMAAPTLAAFNEAVAKGFHRMGVVGTPCQITAVAQMRTNPMAKDDFTDPVALTVGLFCNWSLDTRRLQALLSEKLDVAGIRSMDIPPPPADIMVLQTSGGRVEIPLSDIKALIPQTCFICPDMTSEFADLSVGMFEGRPGWNTLIIRSETGATLVENARNEEALETEDMPADKLAHLVGAAGEKKARALRMLIRRELINTPAGGRSAVRMPPDVIEKILS